MNRYKSLSKLLILMLVGACFSLTFSTGAVSAPLRNLPVTIEQPDGKVLEVFASGDEYYNWLHDAQQYTIVQDSSGHYVYAIMQGTELLPSSYIVGMDDPANLGLEKNLAVEVKKAQFDGKTDEETMAVMAAEYSEMLPEGSPANPELILSAPKKGSIKNLVIFIRCYDDPAYSSNISTYNTMFNNSAAGANSMYNYYREVSYNTLSITTNFYPTTSSTVLSYRDSHNRGYFAPYSATNTIGYTTDTQRRDREHTLLVAAVNAVKSQIPTSLNLDGDNDGNVDNVVFIMKGSATGWNSLLWPHQWSLYTQNVYISTSAGNKKVYTYNFQLETALNSSGVGVLCHEMFHSLGAPDLYHYTNNGIAPVGKWDIMQSDLNPPQHMSAYMKYRYGTWISSIPKITSPGTYSLNPLTSSTGNCYRIDSTKSSSEYFVVEYRKKTTTFESSLPGEGLLVYRVNTARDGQGNRNGPPDELYVYRPGGTTTANGTVDSANFSSNVGRTQINDTTNPSSFLSTGGAGGLNISNIGAVGATINFNVGGTFTAQVTSLYPVSNAKPGQTSTLWAYVKNTGSTALPSNAVVWYYVRGPGVDKWLGSVSAAGIGAGASQWRGYNWAIPASSTPGTYTYWAIVYLGNTTAISAWSSPQNFAVTGSFSAQVTSLWSVSNAKPGQTSTLWAYVKNTGSTALPSNAVVWYYVRGPGVDKWLGSVSAAGIGAGASQWRGYNWAIPASATPGTYTYWAIVYLGNTTAISPWSSPQNFAVTGSSTAGFDSQFNGSAANWLQDTGVWSIYSSAYYYTEGRAGYHNTSTYNQTYSNLDYSAKLWRSGPYANRLIIRGSGSVTSDGLLQNGYCFQYMDDGQFNVIKLVNGSVTSLKVWGPSSAIIKGAAWNTLRVKAFGSSMYFYINGTRVWSGTDSSLTSGRVGVGTYRSTSAANGFWVDWATLTIPSSLDDQDAFIDNDSNSSETNRDALTGVIQ